MAGPCVSRSSATSRPSCAEISRIDLATVRTQSCGAWDMLKRKMFTPSFMSCSRAGGVQVAGPRVMMILVRRIVRKESKGCALTVAKGRKALHLGDGLADG